MDTNPYEPPQIEIQKRIPPTGGNWRETQEQLKAANRSLSYVMIATVLGGGRLLFSALGTPDSGSVAWITAGIVFALFGVYLAFQFRRIARLKATMREQLGRPGR